MEQIEMPLLQQKQKERKQNEKLENQKQNPDIKNEEVVTVCSIFKTIVDGKVA